MLDIETFDNERGGSVRYKALAHPLAAEGLARLAAEVNRIGTVAIIDPDAMAAPLLALIPPVQVEAIYMQDALSVGQTRGGLPLRSLMELPRSQAACMVLATFETRTWLPRVTPYLPASRPLHSLDRARLPDHLLTKPARYLDPLNFATNFAFFRDDDSFGTQLTTVNYWARYGARAVRLYARLYDASGRLMAEWEQEAPCDGATLTIDSAEIRHRFRLPAFTGQLFLHAVGAAGHDILKYALDVRATNGGASLSVTHDANAWPAERYAGLPAPAEGERVVLWIQNSHGRAIPQDAIGLNRMGSEAVVRIHEEIAPFATQAIDISRYLPELRWPAQIELRTGRHVVRPRYEVTRAGRTRISHVNVERMDLHEDAQLRNLSADLGRGFLLPFPILPRRQFRTWVQPTPMALTETDTPLRLDIFDAAGDRVLEHFIGVLPRHHDLALDLDTLVPRDSLHAGGHAELVYDFRAGGRANGWMHAMFRYEHRDSGHVAESSFGSHIFNTIMTYRNEPQSYSGPPPGLSTRLYLRLGRSEHESFCVLIYPASAPWRTRSSTELELHAGSGELIDTRPLSIACSGSAILYASAMFDSTQLQRAGALGYVLVRDATCRLFGFHGFQTREGGFSFDHMFGF